MPCNTFTTAMITRKVLKYGFFSITVYGIIYYMMNDLRKSTISPRAISSSVSRKVSGLKKIVIVKRNAVPMPYTGSSYRNKTSDQLSGHTVFVKRNTVPTPYTVSSHRNKTSNQLSEHTIFVKRNTVPTPYPGSSHRNKTSDQLSEHTIFSKRNTSIFTNCSRNLLTNVTLGLTSFESVETLTRKDVFACSHFITLSEYMGRTGNQMFQVAALMATAINNGYTPILPKSSPLADWFDLPNLADIQLRNVRRYKEKQCCIYSETINHLDHRRNWTLTGYFQSWKYFAGAETVIRETFKLKMEYLEEARNFLKNVSVSGRSNICVHYRRGDLQMKSARKKGHAMADLGYLKRAMNYFRKLVVNVQFIVLSDGIFWCRDNIRWSDVIFSPFYRPAKDMALMTLCDHVIVTSGSFGWWGAWLAGGQTVYFKGFPAPRSFLASQLSRTDYYPTHWVGLR